MQAGATTLKLMADIADVQRKFAQVGSIAQNTAGAVGRVFDGLGLKIGAALSVGGLAAWVKSSINAGDEMSKLAQKTGVAVKDVAGLQLAFRQSGVSAEQLVPIMAKLGVAISGGNDALKAMGIASRNADGSLKSTREVLGDVATAFAGYQDGAAKTALAVKLFGEEGAKLMPLLNGGADALDQFDAMALKLGLTMDTQTAKQAERFNDTLDLMGQGMAGVGRQVAAQLLPTLSGLANQFFNSMSEGDRLGKASQFLGNVLKGLYVVALGVVEVFNGVGKTLGGVAAIVVNVLQGNFTMAGDIARQLKEDLTGGWRETLAQIEKAWNATGSASFEAMAATNAQLRAQAPLLESAKQAQEKLTEARKNDFKVVEMRNKAAEAAYKTEMAYQAGLQDRWFDQDFEADQKRLQTIESQIKAAREMAEALEFENSMLGMNATQRAVANAERTLELQGVIKGTQAYDAYMQKIRSLVEQQAKTQEYNSLTQSLSSSIEEGILQGFRDGKGWAQVFARELEAQFAKVVLRPMIEPLAKAGAQLIDWGMSALMKNFLPSFAGGGGTGLGPRSGGMDGQGGFLAMLHPKETVVDHTRTPSTAVQAVTINQNYYVGDGANRTDMLSAAQLGAAMARQQIRDDMERGRL